MINWLVENQVPTVTPPAGVAPVAAGRPPVTAGAVPGAPSRVGASPTTAAGATVGTAATPVTGTPTSSGSGGSYQTLLWNKVYKMLFKSLSTGEVTLDEYQINRIKRLGPDKSKELLNLVGWQYACDQTERSLSEETLLLAENLGINVDESKFNICTELKKYAGKTEAQIKDQVKATETNKLQRATGGNTCTNTGYDLSQPNGFFFRDPEGSWCLKEENVRAGYQTRTNPLSPTSAALDENVVERMEEYLSDPKYSLNDTVSFVTNGYILRNRKREEISKIQALAFKTTGKSLPPTSVDRLANNPISLLRVLGYDDDTINEIIRGLEPDHQKLIGLILLNRTLENVPEKNKLKELNAIIEKI